MPSKAQELWTQLGGPGAVAQVDIRALDTVDTAGWRVTRMSPLFPKEEHAAA
jgi:methionyl-tRNA synthetase